MEGHCRIAERLRQAQDAEEDAGLDAHDAARDGDLPGRHAEELLADVPGGADAAAQLAREGSTTTAGSLFQWFVRAVLAGERPKVFVHGPGGCGKSHLIRAIVTTLLRELMSDHDGDETSATGRTLWESLSGARANAAWQTPQEETPPFVAADYVCRIEWQKRGMPHAHIVLWCPAMHKRVHKVPEEKNQTSPVQPMPYEFGPDDEVTDYDDIPEPANIPQIYDRYVTTTAPGRWRDVYDNPIMADLTERLRHKHSAYCGFRQKRVCRFGYPAPMMCNARAKTTKESIASGSKNHFFVRRRPGSGYMNPYNPVILCRMASPTRRTRASFQQELRQANVNICNDEWERRVEKRLSAVAMTMNSQEYQKMLKHRRSAERSGTASTLTDLPETPLATDKSISKRMWEKQLQQWRAAIKQWCSIEGIVLVVVISDSEGRVARHDRRDIRYMYMHMCMCRRKCVCVGVCIYVTIYIYIYIYIYVT